MSHSIVFVLVVSCEHNNSRQQHKVIWAKEGKNAIIPNEIIPVDIEFQALLLLFGFS